MNSLLGILIGFGMVIVSFIIEGGKIGSLFLLPPAMIIFGGTFGAVIGSFPMDILKRTPKILKVVFSNKNSELPKLIAYFKDVSTKTRRNGLLSLESEISGDSAIDPFIKKGLQMVVDGLEPQSVRTTLELQTEMMSERHHEGASIFEAAGGYSPTLGVTGTVMGMVHILGNLSGDSSALAPLIAGAFIATLYGIAFANLVFLPMASKLKAIDKSEVKEKMLIIEAVTLIQEGVNPNVISEKLKSFLNNEELKSYEDMDKAVEV